MADFAFAPIKTTVGIASLEAWDIRVGAIERVEEIPRSDKLMKLIVNFGDHSRTISCGHQKRAFRTREVAGRQELFVVNLEPRRRVKSPRVCLSTLATPTVFLRR